MTELAQGASYSVPLKTEDNSQSPSLQKGMVSVNARGGQTSIDPKRVVAFGIFAGLVIGGACYLGKSLIDMNQAKKRQVAEAEKHQNSSAQVGARRIFANDPPVTLPSAPVQPTQPTVDIDGRTLVVPAIPNTGSVEPPLSGARQQGNGTAPRSRYGGDVIVPATPSSGLSSLNMPSSSATTHAAAMVQDMLTRTLGTSSGGAATAGGANSGGGMIPTSVVSGGTSSSNLGSMLTPTQTPMVSAAKLSERNMLLPKGRSIECVLTTRLISEVPGMTSCVLTSNIYSDTGRTVLLERGSEAVGEYSSNIAQGQRRIFVLWSRIKTPNGIVINLNSPGTDSLGTSGLNGEVDNRWGERIGAAFLLSIVQDAIGYQVAKETSQNNNGSAAAFQFQNTSRAGDSMAQRVLESTINIKPVLYKNQGDRISIFVARDLDFANVYALRAR